MPDGQTIADLVRRVEQTDASLATFGFRVGSVSPGQATLSMRVESGFTNGHGVAHGGVIFALADTAFAVASGTMTNEAATTDASIAYFSPALLGEELVAEAHVRHVVGRRSLVDVTVRSGTRVVAEYRGRGTSSRPTTTPSP